MSNRKAETATVTFKPVVERKPRPPSAWLFILGVAYPATVIAIELITHMCADSFFDPIPTYWHLAAALFVPAGNLLTWLYLDHEWSWNAKWVAFGNGAAIAIAAAYALPFIPLMPLAVVGTIFGIGFLPLAPLVSFACALRLRVVLSRARQSQPLGRQLAGGLAAGVLLLIALDVPQAATRLGIQMAASGVPAERERGLTLLRTLGDDDFLLRLCYGITGRPTGLLSGLVMLTSNDFIGTRQRVASPAEAREIYYRLHGEPFNARPAPFRFANAARFADMQFDPDHGGTQVGGRMQGLTLASSRIDGSISGDDLAAYLEWTIEFKNSAAIDREARLQIALPPGGVVSRATLWVDGEEREAAFGGRGEVRAAYRRVAVQQRRDPLLVTTKGADRVLAQAFPVPRNGGTIKFKLGITAPLDLTTPGKARLTLPALVDRNFSIGADVSHNVWIESRQALSAPAGLATSHVDGRLYRISGALDDRALSGTRQAITLDRSAAGRRVARIGGGEAILQEITRGEPTRALMLVIDGSARLAGTSAQLLATLDAIPAGMKVGAIIATEPTRRVPLAPWSDLQKASIAKLLRATSFAGGQDNTPALADAPQVLELEPQSTLLWIHGPQPVNFSGSAARLEQATARLSRLPNVVLYSVEPGPNEVLPDAPWAWGAHALPQTGAMQADLAGFFARSAGGAQTHIARRPQDPVTDGTTTGSDHITRLWANDRVLELMRTSGHRAEAVALATRYQLVTPVSGAVVLETKQQYDAARLTPVDQATVPTVPEPHEWALIIIACAALMWLAWRHRQHSMAVA